MKKVYIPTMDELYELQSLGVNVHKYLVAKSIEALIMEDTIYEEIDMLEVVYEHFSEFPEIIHTICRMYPERISDSTRALEDITLWRTLTNRIPKQDRTIYFLDDLKPLSENVISDSVIIENLSKFLADELLVTPRYRFDYKEPNILLDNIFACDLPIESISDNASSYLLSIDPIYSLKLGLSQTNQREKISKDMLFELKRSITRYSVRYCLPTYDQYQNKDILTNPDEKTKKLIRCIEYHKNNCQL